LLNKTIGIIPTFLEFGVISIFFMLNISMEYCGVCINIFIVQYYDKKYK